MGDMNLYDPWLPGTSMYVCAWVGRGCREGEGSGTCLLVLVRIKHGFQVLNKEYDTAAVPRAEAA